MVSLQDQQLKIKDNLNHILKQWKSLILKYKVDPKNICETVKYFIYNDNVTGQIISVDSGQSLAWKTPDIINNKE